MAFAPVLAAVSIAASAGSAIMGAIGAAQQGRAQAQQAQYQAQIARFNQQVALQNRDYQLAKGETEAQIFGRREAQRMGQIKARIGASGVDIGSGSPEDVQTSQRLLTSTDLQQIRANAARSAYGEEVKGVEAGAQATMYDTAASNIRSAIPFQVAGSLLSGAASVSGKWLQFNQSGVFSSGGSSNPYGGGSPYMPFGNSSDSAVS